MPNLKRIARPGQKRLLAIDGGGIRGLLALAILRRIECILRARCNRPEFRLADYFDYISGTSTGGIIAAGLSLGKTVDEIIAFYRAAGAQMFAKANLLRRLRHKFEGQPLATKLKDVFGPGTTFGSADIRTLLLLIMRNATTDSPWPLSNNPFAKYNHPDRPDSNLHLPLWQLVRASTAAPTYFPPEVIIVPGQDPVKGRQFVFVDGGVTMYNNPAFQMFLMATLECYWSGAPEGQRGWATGPDKMLVVSVGTGTSPNVRVGLRAEDMNVLFNATNIPSALMFAALNEQDLLCRVFGRCLAGDPLDRELGDLIGGGGLIRDGKEFFAYVRYNAELTRAGLDAIGCKAIEPQLVQRLDSTDGMDDLLTVGAAVAVAKVREEHFRDFPPD